MITLGNHWLHKLQAVEAQVMDCACMCTLSCMRRFSLLVAFKPQGSARFGAQELPSDTSPFVLLHPPVNFQIALSIMVNPPKPGDESHEQYWHERNAEIASLRRRAHMVTDGFNALEGVTCNFTEGAMYSFPRVSGWLQGCCSALGQQGKQKGVVVVCGGVACRSNGGQHSRVGGVLWGCHAGFIFPPSVEAEGPCRTGLCVVQQPRTMHLVLVVAQLCANALLVALDCLLTSFPHLSLPFRSACPPRQSRPPRSWARPPMCTTA